MKIRMLNDCPGSRDGLRVENFRKGVEYDVPESLAKCFIDSKTAVDASTKVETKVTDTPMQTVNLAKEDTKAETKKNDSKSSRVSEER